MPKANSITSKNETTSAGKGFVYQFNHLDYTGDKDVLMCINNGNENHFDRFGMGNVQVAIEANENAVTWTYPDYMVLTNSVRINP